MEDWRFKNQPGQVIDNTTLSITLVPGAARGGSENKDIYIPTNVDRVRLELKLQTNEYQNYRAVLQREDGVSIFTGDKLKAENYGAGEAVRLSMPATLLTIGDYQLNLSGQSANGQYEDIGRYYLRIAKR